MGRTVLGIIGGSGVYDIAGLEHARWERVASPWGEASDELHFGTLDGVDMVFLPRHGRGHIQSPTTINYRANIDALKRASATRITAVLPYYGYSRQDRKVQPRVPITSKLVADLITSAGANRVLTVDLHAGQIQGFFNIPVDNLFASPVLLEYIREKKFNNLTVVSPDAGGVERARAFAKRLDAALAIIDKRRDKPNVAQVMHIIGDVKGHDCLLLDDMVDTAGTLTEGAAALRTNGAGKICAACTHAVLSGPAISRINESALDELITTNTIALDSKQQECRKLKVLSVAPLLAEAITRIHEETSLSSLFV